MTRRAFTIPEIGLIAGTRVALGVGIGLLLSDKLRGEERRCAGWVLVGIGAVTTFPIIVNMLGKPHVPQNR
jgi:multisubunit Na+/H+ antiporter MnhB subunit